MKKCFFPHTFRGRKSALIAKADAVIEHYMAQGFRLTWRQLFYQLVARGQLRNTRDNYVDLYKTCGEARDAGLIDWDAIEDRAREVVSWQVWQNPSEIIASSARRYTEDLWAGQEFRPEVVIEKDALLGVIED